MSRSISIAIVLLITLAALNSCSDPGTNEIDLTPPQSYSFTEGDHHVFRVAIEFYRLDTVEGSYYRKYSIADEIHQEVKSVKDSVIIDGSDTTSIEVITLVSYMDLFGRPELTKISAVYYKFGNKLLSINSNFYIYPSSIDSTGAELNNIGFSENAEEDNFPSDNIFNTAVAWCDTLYSYPLEIGNEWLTNSSTISRVTGRQSVNVMGALKECFVIERVDTRRPYTVYSINEDIYDIQYGLVKRHFRGIAYGPGDGGEPPVVGYSDYKIELIAKYNSKF